MATEAQRTLHLGGGKGVSTRNRLMTLAALPICDGFMNAVLEQFGSIARMDIVASDAALLRRISPMGGKEISAGRRMTVLAQGIHLLFQQGGECGSVVLVAGAAPLADRSMYELAFKILPVMTGEADLILMLLEQSLLGTVVRQMTAHTVALLDGIVHNRLGLELIHHFPMAGIAQLGHLRYKKGPADQTVGTVTTSTLPLRNGRMNRTRSKTLPVILMTVQATLASLDCRGA